MASISSLGIGSGLDLTSLLDQLEEAENERLTPIVAQQRSYQTRLSAFGQLESSLSALGDSLDTLAKPETFTAVKSSMTGESVSAGVTGNAVGGRFEVSVSQLARSQSQASEKTFEARSESLELAGTLTFNAGKPNAATLEVASGDSLEDIRDAINQLDSGVNASIVFNGNAYQLTLGAEESGEDAAFVVGDESGLFGFAETVAAQNAMLTVNGVAITSQSNTVEEALEGLTLNLTATTDQPEILTVSRDTESMAKSIQAFVDGWNRFQGTADTLTSYNSETNSAGALLGNSTMRSVEARLRGTLNFDAGEGSFKQLADLGIERQLDGTLSLDEDALEAALQTDSEGVSRLFAGLDGAGGFAASFNDTLGALIDDDGLLANATDGIDTSLERLGDRYTRTQDSIASTVDRYRVQFAQMDQLVAQMNSTSSYLTQQFDALSAQFNQS